MIRRLDLLVLALVLTACLATPTSAPPPTTLPSAILIPTPFPTPPLYTPTAAPSPLPTATATRLPILATALPTRTAVAENLDPGWEVRTILVGPGQPGRLYALLADRWTDTQPSARMRFLVSEDGGASWKNFLGGLPTDPPCTRNVNLDYQTADTLYASTCRGLYRWKAGQWTLISTTQTGMVAVVYGKPQNMWATSYADRSIPVISSRDGGITWQPASNGLAHFNGVANVAIDPRDNRTLYAIIWPKYGGSYLRRGTSEGQWTTMPTPLNNSQIDTGMTIDGATGTLYVSVFVGDSSGRGGWQIWRTREPTADLRAIVWERVYDFGQAGWVTVLASGKTAQGLALYARVSPESGESFVQRSMDGGTTWGTLAIR